MRAGVAGIQCLMASSNSTSELKGNKRASLSFPRSWNDKAAEGLGVDEEELREIW